MGRLKKSDAKHAEKATHNEEASSSKNQGHMFRSLTTTVATMFEYLKKHPDKPRLVNRMGFGALSHLPANNLDQQLLKQTYDRYDVHDNTIYSDAAAVKITTRKIGDALGLCSKGKSAVALTELVQTTPMDTEENRKLFMQAFIIFIQKVFLLPNSTSSIVPTALTTIFDLETTSKKNWALHVHDFLLQELKKAKENNAAAIHGCVYVLMIIYFHEMQFGENSKEVEARPSWIAYWNSDTLKKILKQERTHEAVSSHKTVYVCVLNFVSVSACVVFSQLGIPFLLRGLLKTGEMMAKKDVLKWKNPTMRVPPSERDSESDSEATESNVAADSELDPEPEPEPEPEHDAHKEPPP
ncbi:hypothetical protein PIB30_023662 [Stylosanthes scabra]|uniref:Uncharacterized protein n=1 Tax=Stylosanthes scabra TaxID=79078 RepID=A0ABU6R9U4_9FABA|nr:hypothetical protein [Stylosanthes scabra]